MDEVLFPYSEDEPILRLCKYSGRGHIWCYPGIRNSIVCKTCSMNPDLKEGLSSFNGGERT